MAASLARLAKQRGSDPSPYIDQLHRILVLGEKLTPRERIANLRAKEYFDARPKIPQPGDFNYVARAPPDIGIG